RNGHEHWVTLVRVAVLTDDNGLLGHGRIDDVDRDAVEGAVGGGVAKVRVEADRAKVRDDVGRGRRHRGVRDLLVPGVVEWEELVAPERGRYPGFEFDECRLRSAVTHGQHSGKGSRKPSTPAEPAGPPAPFPIK